MECVKYQIKGHRNGSLIWKSVLLMKVVLLVFSLLWSKSFALTVVSVANIVNRVRQELCVCVCVSSIP